MTEQLASSVFPQLIPIKELSEANRSALAANASVQELSPGARLSARDEAAHMLYLLEGKLGMASQGQIAGTVEGGTPRANLPLFSDRGQHDFAIAETTGRLLRVDKALFSKLLNDENLSGYEVEAEVEVSETESAVFAEIYAAYQAEKLELPAMPEVALRLREAASDPDTGIPEIARIIQMDAAVAGAVLHAANSPLFRGSSEINTVKDALVRLGLKTTQSLATTIAMRQSFQVKSPAIKKRMHQLWEQSVHVSALSYIIARRVGKPFDPERALLAGLLHAIGGVPILQYVEKSGLDPTPDELDAVIGKLCAPIGVLVMKFWNFDPEITSVVDAAGNWRRDTGEAADYTDIVLAARRYSLVGTPIEPQLPALNDMPVFAKLGLGDANDEGRIEVLQEAEGEINGIKAMLNA